MPPFSPALLTDLYELTMAQAYFEEGMSGDAVFSLFVRRLPSRRNYLLTCGLDDVLTFLEEFRFDAAALAYLDSLNRFSRTFLRYLEGLRFTGDVRAMPEGTPVFANEPILEIAAPIIEGQLVEPFVMNQIHLQTVLASKAARIVEAARGRQVVDFGLRRMHGTDAGLKAARAFHIAGVHATSNVAAGQVYGLRVSGTMAHSYIQAHDTEYEAFRAFARRYPDTVLLVDTYDTLAGVQKVIDLAREVGSDFRVSGVRLDSGDLLDLSMRTRRMLDEAGLRSVSIFASSSLDEDGIAHLLAAGAPIDGFGVGSEMGVSPDAPVLDIAYKLVEYGDRGRIKLSTGKSLLPGRKQVFRAEADGAAAFDVIARSDEPAVGRPLLRDVMHLGKRLALAGMTLNDARARKEAEVARLPDRLRAIPPADPPYDIRISTRLIEDTEHLRRQYEQTTAPAHPARTRSA
jgi:nicotinate phosphoribosyltransferase